MTQVAEGELISRERPARTPRILAGLLGATFILSAFLKALDPVAFAVQVSYYGILHAPSWVEGIALGVIALEAALGMALLAGLWLRKVTLPLVLGLLAAFTLLILWGWMAKGLKDCGCFGRYLPMTPPAAMLKNFVLLGVAALAWRMKKTQEPGILGGTGSAVSRFKGRQVGLVACTALLMAGVAARQPFKTQAQAEAPDRGAKPATVRAEGQVTPAQGKLAKYRIAWQGRRLDLSAGVYLVAMISDSCEHCGQIVADLNKAMQVPGFPPVVGLVLGEKDSLERFRQTHKPEFATRLIEPLEFFDLIGEAPPRFILSRDGATVRFWDKDLPEPQAIIQEAGRAH